MPKQHGAAEDVQCRGMPPRRRGRQVAEYVGRQRRVRARRQPTMREGVGQPESPLRTPTGCRAPVQRAAALLRAAIVATTLLDKAPATMEALTQLGRAAAAAAAASANSANSARAAASTTPPRVKRIESRLRLGDPHVGVVRAELRGALEGVHCRRQPVLRALRLPFSLPQPQATQAEQPRATPALCAGLEPSGGLDLVDDARVTAGKQCRECRLAFRVAAPRRPPHPLKRDKRVSPHAALALQVRTAPPVLVAGDTALALTL